MTTKYQRTSEEAVTEARRNLPLEALIFQLAGLKIEKYSTCPFCSEKKKFGTYDRNGTRRYKCFSGGCAANESGDDISFVALWLNLDRKEAFKEFLKLAGVV